MDMTDSVHGAFEVAELTEFALRSSKSLYDKIDKINGNWRCVQELKQNLSGLRSELHSLQAINTNATIALPAPSLPLFNCGQMCENFARIIEERISAPSNTDFDIRNIIQLKYGRKDFKDFGAAIAAYKSTFRIILVDVDSNTEATPLSERKDLIHETIFDLRKLLEDVDKDCSGPLVAAQRPRPDPTVTSKIEDEKLSFHQCLKICSEALKHVEQIERTLFRRQREGNEMADVEAGFATSDRAQNTANKPPDECLVNVHPKATELKAQLRDTKRRLDELSQSLQSIAKRPRHEPSPPSIIEEQLEGIHKSLAECEKSVEDVYSRGVNVVEKIEIGDNNIHTAISTNGHLIFAKDLSAGSCNAMIYGQMSDESSQKLSDNHKEFLRHLSDVVYRNRDSNLADGRTYDGEEPPNSRFLSHGVGFTLGSIR